MKPILLTNSRNQHIVAIEKAKQLRCYFKSSSMHEACAVMSRLQHDINKWGESVVDFENLPIIRQRIARSGRTIYEFDEGAANAN